MGSISPYTDKSKPVVDCNDIFREALRQTTAGYVFKGMTMAGNMGYVPLSLRCKWTACVEKIKRSNVRQVSTIATVSEIFDAEGVEYVMLKGQRTAGLYDNPELRQCGDIDIYFRSSEEMSGGINALRKYRYRETGKNIFGLCRYETGLRLLVRSDRSLVTRLNGDIVEFHPRLPKGISSVKSVDESPEEMLVASALHILRHTVTFGIGLRQVCDLAMECRRFMEYDRKVVNSRIPLLRMLLERHRIEWWWYLLERFLFDYLGVPQSWLPFRGEYGCSARNLLKIVGRGGNFGFHGSSRSFFQAARNMSKFVLISPIQIMNIYTEILLNDISFHKFRSERIR